MEKALRILTADPKIAEALAALEAVALINDMGGGYARGEHDRLCAQIGERLLTIIAEN